MEFGKALKEIRANRDAESHFQWILACLKKQPRRRLQVRALLAKSRTEWRRGRAAHFAEMAGDILWTILKKPRCAEIVYRYALSISDDPLPSLMALFEIAEKKNRYELAHEVARRIVEIASPLEGETIRQRLQQLLPQSAPLLDPCAQLVDLQTKFAGTNEEQALGAIRSECLEILFRDRPGTEEFQKRIDAIQWWLASDSQLREELISELRSKERFQNVITVLSLCVKAVKVPERKALLMQLGHTYRFGVSQLDSARECFQAVVDDDPDDREAWGELLELLGDLDDDEALSNALKKRIEVSIGLEKRELVRQRAEILKRLDRAEQAEMELGQM